MNEFEQRFAANAQQAEYWNSEAGRKWVEYDAAMNERLQPIGEPLLQRAGIVRGEHVLDIGCGAGALTAPVARTIGESGRVLGLDISEPLLALARERCATHEQASFINADAQVHAFEAHSFDLLVSRFGVMFFADPPAAFTNLRGALRDGGRVHFVCWAQMTANPWFAVPLAVAKHHLGAPEPTPPRAPGPLAFAEPDYVNDILTTAGFANVRIDTVATTMRSASPVQHQAEFFLKMGPAARLIGAAAPDEQLLDTLRADLAEELRGHSVDGGIALGATVHYVSASA